MQLSEEDLQKIEHQAENVRNVNLMFLVQILKELREVKERVADLESKSQNQLQMITEGLEHSTKRAIDLISHTPQEQQQKQ